MDKMIRKRMCEREYIKNTMTHIVTGKRLTEHTPSINLSIGDIVPIKVIHKPGIRCTDIEIKPIFINDEQKVKVINIYEKKFKDLKNEDLVGTSELIKNDTYILSLYLALIYDLSIEDVVNDYVTIVNTENI